jgi:hypothetical protein
MIVLASFALSGLALDKSEGDAKILLCVVGDNRPDHIYSVLTDGVLLLQFRPIAAPSHCR